MIASLRLDPVWLCALLLALPPIAACDREAGPAAPDSAEADAKSSDAAGAAARAGASPEDAGAVEVSADGGPAADAGVGDGGLTDTAESAPVGQSSATELAFLSRARRMVRKSPARALAITIDHQRRFKRPHHAELREVVAIEALVRMSRAGEARARARAFFIAYPHAQDGARVRMLLDHNGD